MLLEKQLFETLRDEPEGVQEETEHENKVLGDTPAIELVSTVTFISRDFSEATALLCLTALCECFLGGGDTSLA